MKLGDAGTTDRFDLAFQYQINYKFEGEWTKTIKKIKILYKCIKADAMQFHMVAYASRTTN